MSDAKLDLRGLLSCPKVHDVNWMKEVLGLLGSMANYWLTDQILSEMRTINRHARQVGANRGVLQDAPGCCHVLAVASPAITPSVGAAVILPLQWREMPAHESTLPPGLKCIADRVKAELSKALLPVGMARRPDSELYAKASQIERCMIGFPESGAWPDLQSFGALEQDFESAFGTLAVGLIGRINNLRLRQDIWISLAWDGKPKGVGGLGEKAVAAKRYPCKAIYSTADSFPGGNQDPLFHEVKRDQNDLVLALKEILTHHLIDPLQGRSWEEAIDNEELRSAAYHHYRFLDSVDRVRGSSYYQFKLVPIIGVMCRRRYENDSDFENQFFATQENSSFVCIAAERGDTERILLATWRPKQMILFHDGSNEDEKRRVQSIETLAREIGITNFDLRSKRIPNKIQILPQATDTTSASSGSNGVRESPQKFVESMRKAMLEACSELRSGDRPRIVYDASGGTATMKSVMFSAVLQPGDLVVTLESVRTNPGSELYHLLEFQPDDRRDTEMNV